MAIFYNHVNCRLILITVYTLLTPVFIFAQKDSTKTVKEFSRKNFIQPYMGTFNRSIIFLSNEKNEERYGLRFSPNSSAFAGVSVNYKKLSIYAETSIPNTQKVDRSRTNVRSSALFVHHFTQKWGITGFASWNKGLLMYTPEDEMYEDRNDLRMITIGAHFYNIFNGKKFSYTAANSMTKLQTKSKGSLMLMTTPVFRRLYSSESIIPDTIRQYHLTGTSSPSKSIQFISLQCKPGYIYNFVFGKGRYFISPALYAGAGIEYHTVNTKEERHNDFNLSTGFRAKLVTGINGEKFFLSFELLTDRNTAYLYKTIIKNNYTEMSCNLGFRF